MRSRHLVLVGVAGVCAVALVFWWRGGESPEREVATERDPRPFIRLSVSRNTATGTITIKDSAVVETAAEFPTGLGGHYAVLDGPTGVLTAAPFTFPTEMIEEATAGNITESRLVHLEEQDVIVFLPHASEATGARILNTLGETVAELPGSVLGALVATQPASPAVKHWNALRSMVTPVAHAATPVDGLRAAFPHILFPTDVSGLSAVHQESAEQVEVLDDYWASILNDILSEMSVRSPILFGSIGSIAVAHYIGGGATHVTLCDEGMALGIKRGSNVGNQIVINAVSFQPFMLPDNTDDMTDDMTDSVDDYDIDFERHSPQSVRKTLIHESAHAFHRLVDDTSAALVKENLPADVLDHVNTVREGLGPYPAVLSDTWQRLHGTATIASDNYKGYAGENYKCEYPDVQSAVEAGFASPYGGNTPLEDFATYMELFYDEEVPAASSEVCQQFSGLTDEIPRESVLAFAKLNFQRGLRMISEADYLECVQNADPAKNVGFTIGDKNFTSDLKAGVLRSPGASSESQAATDKGTRFAVMGKTDGLQAMIRTYSPSNEEGSSPTNPIRFFKLSQTLGWMTPYMFPDESLNMITYQPTSGGRIELTRKTRISAQASGAFILVTNDEAGLTKGYAFFVQMDDWMGRSKRHKEETISDFAKSEDEDGPVIFDLIWFRVED
ncbi:MAG: hypothetical protein QGI10_07060 [Vicinamibacterales bacterium]|jgi:hypothetical protein|nr:hypothetical protein [Vicinamibacterales bacterium]|tara:strand:- start:644 stop:2662 length:2019 start_codon:yes stop_codon:yes gene_type:complete